MATTYHLPALPFSPPFSHFNTPVALFLRKEADIFAKWIREAEHQLHFLKESCSGERF